MKLFLYIFFNQMVTKTCFIIYFHSHQFTKKFFIILFPKRMVAKTFFITSLPNLVVSKCYHGLFCLTKWSFPISYHHALVLTQSHHSPPTHLPLPDLYESSLSPHRHFTLRITTALLAETLGDLHHSIQLIHKS